MLSASVRFRAMKKKITFWRCQWELGARNLIVWPYWLTPTDSRRRDWLPVWCLTLLTDSDWQPAPRLTRWLTRTARRHRDWLALIDSDCQPTPRLTARHRLTLSPFPLIETRLIYHIHLIFFFKFQENLYRIYRELEGGSKWWKVEASPQSSHRGGLKNWKGAGWLPPSIVASTWIFWVSC